MEIQINIPLFDKILEYIKYLKSEYVLVFCGYVYGYNERLSVLKYIDSDGDIPCEIHINVKTSDLMAFRKSLEDKDIIKIINPNMIYVDKQKICQRGFYVDYIRLLPIFNNSEYELSNNPIQYGSLRGMQNIEDFLNSKASDGAISIMVDNIHKMILPSSILPVNKSDDLLLEIKDCPNNTFISRFIVVKKKKIFINVLIRFISLIQGGVSD